MENNVQVTCNLIYWFDYNLKGVRRGQIGVPASSEADARAKAIACLVKKNDRENVAVIIDLKLKFQESCIDEPERRI